MKCIHRIENIELWRAYCSKRDGVERLRGDANEKWYWHGTKTLSPEVIAKEGFDFRVANPGSFGRGAYFAHSVNYSSSGYQHIVPASYQVHQSDINSHGKSLGKKHKGFHYGATTSSYNMGTIGASGFGMGGFGAPTYYSNNTTTVTNSVMAFPPGVGIGDSQLILARVCVGKTSEGGNMVRYLLICLFIYLFIIINLILIFESNRI